MKYTITFEACSDKEAQALYMIFWAMVEARKAMQEKDAKTAMEGDGENITYMDVSDRSLHIDSLGHSAVTTSAPIMPATTPTTTPVSTDHTE